MTVLGPEYRDLPLARVSVPAMDASLGKLLQVGHAGWVRILDYMGDDTAIVEAARQSFGEGTRPVSDDRSLLRYLMRHWHTTPYEMAVVKLHIRLPLYVARQWFRHRTGAFNEYSFRYSEALPYVEETGEGNFRVQSAGNKQGSGDLLDPAKQSDAALWEQNAFDAALGSYGFLLEDGVSREQARKVLPMAQYTEFVWRVDLHNLFNFLRLRLAGDAQEEIREFADAIAGVVKTWTPLAWEAFVDYRLEMMNLTRLDIAVMTPLLEAHSYTYMAAVFGRRQAALAAATQMAEHFGWLKYSDQGVLLNVRERGEFEAKMARLRVPVPWLNEPPNQEG